MALSLTISQIAAASYPGVLAAKRKPQNQWAESSVLREFERQGMIEKISMGPTIEVPLDVQFNQGAEFQATDMATTSTAKTDILGSASYTPANLVVPVTWSLADEAQNPTENQKVSLVAARLSNAIDSHDDRIENGLFQTSTNGFLGMATHAPTTGQGTDGGIDASTVIMWRNPQGTYLADGSDIEAQFTSVYNSAAKGSGSPLVPTIMFSGSTPHALFESTQVPMQRYDSQDFKAGAKMIMFKTARYVFSQYGGSKVYGGNPKSLQLVVSRQYFRAKGETAQLPNAVAMNFKIYSSLQLVTGNKSRLFVCDAA